MCKKYEVLTKVKGIPLDEIGINGFAFQAEDALLAIELIKDARGVVYGGDVLDIVNGLPEMGHDNWSCDEQDFSNVSCEYIRSYRDAHGENFLYQLVSSFD